MAAAAVHTVVWYALVGTAPPWLAAYECLKRASPSLCTPFGLERREVRTQRRSPLSSDHTPSRSLVPHGVCPSPCRSCVAEVPVAERRLQTREVGEARAAARGDVHCLEHLVQQPACSALCSVRCAPLHDNPTTKRALRPCLSPWNALRRGCVPHASTESLLLAAMAAALLRKTSCLALI